MPDATRKTPDHAALASAAERHLARGEVKEAFVCTMRAVNAAPHVRVYQERFLDLARRGLPLDYSDELANAFAVCLGTPDLASRLENWAALLYMDPRFRDAYGLDARVPFDPANAAFFTALTDFRPLLTPLFLAGVKAHVVCNAVFEEFITHVRRHLLDNLNVYGRLPKPEHLALASAIAHYALFTEFILDVTYAEDARVDALQRRIETHKDAANDPAVVATLACYRPLYALTNARQLLETFRESEPLSTIVREHIADLDALREAAAAIPSATKIGAGVSSRVREQYEAFPYPRWKALSHEHIRNEWRTDECSQRAESPLAGRQLRILIAGCGTGREAVTVASIFPDATITAIDLSRTSLGYAAIKAREQGLCTIAFRHGDILQLGAGEGPYDYITATGVLHHMEDPIQGWRVLCGMLAPGGLMRVALYSETGRKGVVAARETIAKRGYPSTREGMLRFRRESPTMLERTVLLQLAGLKDYYHLSMYRDFLFHVQEHRFDLPAIETILKDLGLAFVGFHVPADTLARYRAIFPADPTATQLGNWDVFEQRNPLTFQSMYTFWCRKPE